MEANSTGGQGSRRAVAPSGGGDDDDDDDFQYAACLYCFCLEKSEVVTTLAKNVLSSAM
jgi:hypothetical protein